MRRIAIVAVLLLTACPQRPADNNANTVEAANEVAASETPKIDCEIIHERVTQEECDDIGALSRDVREGAAALDVPDPMTRGRKSQVTLVVDRRPLREIQEAETAAENAADTVDLNATEQTANAMDTADNAVGTDDDQQNAIATASPGDAPTAETPNQVVQQLPGKDYAFGSKVGRYMKATLVGQGFDINLIAPRDPVQEVAAGGQATWIWEVVPKQDGLLSLTAKTEAVAIIDGRAKPLGDGQTSKTVTVEVRTIDRIWDFLAALPAWFKLIAGVIGGVTIVVVAWVKLRVALRGGKSVEPIPPEDPTP